MASDRPRERTIFTGLSSDIERQIKEFFVDDPSGFSAKSVWSPPTDVYEDEDALVLRMEIPGVPADEIDVSVIDDRLVVRGNRKRSTEFSCKPCYLQVEIHYGAFVRIVPLRPAFDPGQVEASHRDGFLTVRIARRADALPASRRKIDVHGVEDES